MFDHISWISKCIMTSFQHSWFVSHNDISTSGLPYSDQQLTKKYFLIAINSNLMAFISLIWCNIKSAAAVNQCVQIWRAWTGVFAKFTPCHGLFAARGSKSCLLLVRSRVISLPRISSPHVTACLRARESNSCLLLVRSRFISLPRIGQFSTGSQKPAIVDIG